MARLDQQRAPVRYHTRKNSRAYHRGYAVNPHTTWGDTGTYVPPAFQPTGVIAGTPGSFTPPTATIPANLTTLQGLGPLGATTAWTVGQRVVLGDASEAYWAGTVWLVGRAPVIGQTDVHVTSPENYTVADLEAWVDAHADLADELLAAEQARQTPRVTLVNWLQGFISNRDDGTIP